MTKRLFFGLTVLITALAVIFSACPNDTTTTTVAAPPPAGGPPGPTLIPLESVAISRPSVRVKQGKAVVLTATVLPGNTTDSKEVTWSTSDPTIATVSGGTVTGVSIGGPVTITVTTNVGNKTDTCQVTVVDVNDPSGEGGDNIPVTGVRLITEDFTIEAGAEPVALEWEVLPSTALNQNVTWIYSPPGLVEVKNGLLGANAEGEVTLTVKTEDGGFEDSITVTITKPSDIYTGGGTGEGGETPGIDDSGGVDPNDPTKSGNATLKNDDLTLSVTIDGTDPIKSYQWYKALSADSYTGAVKIPGETRSTYTPSTSVAGTFHYFVEITFESLKKQVSAIKTVTVIVYTPPPPPGGGDGETPTNPGDGENHGVNANQPKITQQPTPADKWYVIQTNANNVTPIVVKANKRNKTTDEPDGGILSYQWFSNTTSSNSGGTSLGPAAKYTFTDQDVDVDIIYKPIIGSNPSVTYYYVEITNTNNVSPDDGGLKVRTVKSQVAKVEIRDTFKVDKPEIEEHPKGGSFPLGSEAILTAAVKPVKNDNGGKIPGRTASYDTLTYQWYISTTNSTTGGTALADKEGNPAKGNVPTSGENAGVVTYKATTTIDEHVDYYYCVFTNTITGAVPQGPNNTNLEFAQDGRTDSTTSYVAFVGTGITVNTIAYDPTGAKGIFVVTREYTGDGPLPNSNDPDTSRDVIIRGNLGVYENLTAGNTNNIYGIRWKNTGGIEIKGWKRTEADYVTPSTINDKMNANYWRGTAKGRLARSDATTGEGWDVLEIVDADTNEVVKLTGVNSNAHILVMPNLKGKITKAPGASVIRPTTMDMTIMGKWATMSEPTVLTLIPGSDATATKLAALYPYHREQQREIEYAYSTQKITNNTPSWNIRSTTTNGVVTIDITANTAVTAYLPDNKWTTDLTIKDIPAPSLDPNVFPNYYIYARTKGTTNFLAGNVFLSQSRTVASIVAGGAPGGDSTFDNDIGAQIKKLPSVKQITDGTFTLMKDAEITTSARRDQVTGQDIEYYITTNSAYTEANANNGAVDNTTGRAPTWTDYVVLPNNGGYKFGSSTDPLKAWGILACNTNYYVFSRARANNDYHAGSAKKGTRDSSTNSTLPYTTTDRSNVYFEPNSPRSPIGDNNYLPIWDAPLPYTTTIIPNRNGYIFEGWYTDPQGIRPFNHNVKVMTSVKLYGMWVSEGDLSGDITKKTKTNQYGDMTYVEGGWFERGSLNWSGDNWPTTSIQGHGANNVERPASTVAVTGFWIGTHEVTQESYTSIMNRANPSYFEGTSGGQPSGQPDRAPAAGETQNRRPVENVSWYEAIFYCNRRSALEFGNGTDYTQAVYIINGEKNPSRWNNNTVPTIAANSDWDSVEIDYNAKGYRLPTEAQWEYACRASTNKNTTTSVVAIANTAYGKGLNSAGQVVNQQVDYWAYNYNNTYRCMNMYLDRNFAWYSSDNNSKQANSGTTAHAGNKTHEIGKKLANAFNLYDMSGNVAEWVWDFSPENILPYNNVAYTTTTAYASKAEDYKNVNPDGLEYAKNATYYYHIPRGGAWNSESYGNDTTEFANLRRYHALRPAARGLTSANFSDQNSVVKAVLPYQKQNTVGFRVMRPLMTEIPNQTSVPRVRYVAP